MLLKARSGIDADEDKVKVAYRIGRIIMVLAFVSCASPNLERRQASGVYHRVKEGETIHLIAQAYKINVKYLAEVNNIDASQGIEAGRVLFIPGAQQIIDLAPTAVAKVKKEERAEKKPESPSVKTIVQDRAADSKDAGPKEQKKSPTGKSAAPPVKEKAKAVSEKSPAGSPKGEKAKVSAERGPKGLPGEEKARAMPEKAPKGSPGEEKAKAIPEKAPKDTPVEEKTVIFPPTLPKKESALPPMKDEDSSEDGKKTVPDKKRFIWPVTGKVITRYGIQPNGMFYNGIKIATKESSVIAAADGTVILSSLLKDFGETIFMKHDDNYVTVYTNLGQRLVKTDDHVKKGTAIATLAKADEKGESSLYFEVRYMNKARNPLIFLP